MVSPGASIDAAINGLNKHLANAVDTASQLSRNSDEIITEASEAEETSSEESGSDDDGLGGFIDVTA